MKTKSTRSKFLFALATILCCIISINSFGQTPCDPPSGLSSTGITTSEATLNWTVVNGAAGYNVNYRIVGDPSWNIITSTTESVTLSSLSPSSSYEWQVQTDCGNSNVSAFTASETFSTPALVCDVPIGLNTTGITVSDATMNWRVVPGAAGYNIQYRIVGAPSWTLSSSWALSSATTASLNVSSLAAGNYEWQVQTDCGNSSVSAFSASDNFTTLAPQVCDVPVGLNITGVTTTNATMSWTGVAGAQSYNVRYRSYGNATWTEVSSTASSLTVSLTPATTYECQVQTVCVGGNKSYYGKPASFNTLSASGCNAIPTGLSAVGTSATTALLSWNGGASANGYAIQYRVTGAQTWSVMNSSGNSAALSGLSPASYEWMVSTDCGNNNRSAFSAIATFSMGSSQSTSQYILSAPNTSDPSSRSAMFLSSGSSSTDVQIVRDWLAAHGIH